MCQPGFHIFCYGSTEACKRPDPALRCDCGVYRWGQAPDLSRESLRGQIDRLSSTVKEHRAKYVHQDVLFSVQDQATALRDSLRQSAENVERLTVLARTTEISRQTALARIAELENELRDRTHALGRALTVCEEAIKTVLMREKVRPVGAEPYYIIDGGSLRDALAYVQQVRSGPTWRT